MKFGIKRYLKEGIQTIIIKTLFLLQLVPLDAVGEELKLVRVLQSVKSNHPLLLATLEEQATAEADLLSAQGAFDRSLKLDSSSRATGYYEGSRLSATLDQPIESFGGRVFGSYRRSDGRVPIYEEELETLTNGELSAGIEVPFLRDGPIDRRRANIRRFQLQGDIATASVEDRLIQLGRAASFVYYDWIAAGERVRIFERLLKVAEDRGKQLAERVKHGDLPAFDLADNDRQIFQRRAQLVQAQRNLQNASFELSLFLRDETGGQLSPIREQLPNKLELSINPKKFTEDDALQAAFARRPELKRLERQLEQNTVERNLAQNQLLPRLDLQLIASQDSGSGSKTLEEGELKAGVKVDIPLQVRTAQGRINAAEAKERELKRLVQFQKERITTDVRDSLNSLSLAYERYHLAKSEISAAVKLEEGERTRFMLGDSNLIFVNVREQTSAEASVRSVDAAQDFLKALANYRAVRGLAIEEITRELGS
jgi:cobalt-zinc-cadmium efflux system outer membrane protein